MNSDTAAGLLAGLGSAQNGLFTRQQAAAAGVAEQFLAALRTRRVLTRVIDGVYRIGADEPDRRDEAHALWLLLDPAGSVGQATAPACGVLSHDSAANWVDPLAFGGVSITVTFPPGSGPDVDLGAHRNRVRVVSAPLAPNDWFLYDGVPVTSPARTVRDLMDDDADTREIGRLLAGMARAGVVEFARLAAQLDDYAQREDYRDGEHLVTLLRGAAAPDSEHSRAVAT